MLRERNFSEPFIRFSLCHYHYDLLVSVIGEEMNRPTVCADLRWGGDGEAVQPEKW